MTVATGFPYDISYAGGTSRSLYCDASLSFYACPDVPNQIAPAHPQQPAHSCSRYRLRHLVLGEQLRR